MKTLIKTIITTTFALALFFAGSFVVNAASGQFDSDPSGNGTGFLSIKTGNSCSGCANQQNSISVNIPNQGNTQRFTLYTDFRNKGNATIFGAEGVLNVSNSNGIMSGTLSGSGASSITDAAYLNNLPNDFEITFVNGYVENTHGTTDPAYCSGYNNYNTLNQIEVLNSGAPLGNLDTVQNGWCDQGYFVATFEIENTETTTSNIEVSTLNESNVDINSAQLNGRLDSGNNANVWFRYSTSSNVSCSNGTYVDGPNSINAIQNFNADISGLNDDTHYYYVACADDGNQTDQGNTVDFYTEEEIITVDLNVQTREPENITTSSAQLNGRLDSGNNAEVWFALSTSSNPSCSNNSHRVDVSGSYDSGDYFDKVKTGLSSDTHYYYRACAEQGGENAQGSRYDFYTEDITTTYTYSWEPGEWGSCIDNIQTLDYDCVRSPGGDIVSNNLCFTNVGPMPVTQQDCNINGLMISTDDVSNLMTTNGGLNASATANGDVFSGSTNYVYFVFAEDNINVSCFDGLNQQVAENHTLLRTNGDDFEWTFGGLYTDTDYHYRACGIDNFTGSTIQGQIESFTTPNTDSNNEPSIDTKSPQNVDEDSAKLRGDVDMNDFNNGIVFFVYGQDESMVEDVEDDYYTYDDVNDDEENDEFEVKLSDNNFDGDDSFNENVTNLEEDERYYYQICVEFNNDEGNDEIKCGGVEEFDTDNDNNDDDDVDIQTELPRNVTQTTAEMCGDLVDDAGDSQQTWIEFRSSNETGFNLTPIRQRSEGSFCERVSGLQSNTTYYYKACTPDDCDSTRSFRTLGINIPTGKAPIIVTNSPTNIRNNSATLNGTYVANAPSGTCWFDYGRTSSLGRSTKTYNVTGYGACTHSFTQLSSNTQYCVQAVIRTIYGTDRGSVQCFNTPGGGGPVKPPVIVIDDDDDVDLSVLGLGLSLVRLEINDDEEVLVRGENVEYVVEWENVSELDLTDLDLKVVMPPEIQVIDISRGRFDQDENTIYFTIDELDGIDVKNNTPGDRGEMTISGVVDRGVVGNLVTAEAELSYDNPVNGAKEDAVDWDVDGYGVQVAGVTASVFGLADITLLGWLVILLGLFIIFLVARWLYLEREEMRAQAYGGYAPAYGHAQPQVPVYREPPQQYAQPHGIPPVAAPAPEATRNDYYEPYRPNRG